MRRSRLGWLAVGMALLVAACTTDSEQGTTRPTTGAAATTTTGAAETTTSAALPPSTTDAPTPVAVDGVTVTEDTINLGLLADLTGPFSGNVVDLIDAQLAFWSNLNAEGGIAGRQVELYIVDTSYDLQKHQDAYADLRDRVLLFTHSTGSPHTASIADDLFADNRLAIPVSWYSGWADPELGTNVLEVGSNYCIEAMNTLSWIAQAHQSQAGAPPTIAIATVADDYGQDSAAGARYAAEQLGLDIAFDGEGQIVPGGDLGPVVAGIAGSGADYTWLATDPITMAALVSGALTLGYQGGWSGAMPTFSPRLLDTALGEYLSQAWILSVLYAPVGADVDGMDDVYTVLREAFPNRFPSDGLIKGYLEFEIARQLLERAAAAGDLTPAGVLEVARNTDELAFGGISPPNLYSGTLDEAVARETAIYRPSKALFDQQGGLGATFSDGAVAPYELLQDFFVSDLAAEYEFEQPCFLVGP